MFVRRQTLLLPLLLLFYEIGLAIGDPCGRSGLKGVDVEKRDIPFLTASPISVGRISLAI